MPASLKHSRNFAATCFVGPQTVRDWASGSNLPDTFLDVFSSRSMMSHKAKEFGLNRCPFFTPGQMMTPDRIFVAGSCLPATIPGEIAWVLEISETVGDREAPNDFAERERHDTESI